MIEYYSMNSLLKQLECSCELTGNLQEGSKFNLVGLFV